jgi:hypothetical protein
MFLPGVVVFRHLALCGRDNLGFRFEAFFVNKCPDHSVWCVVISQCRILRRPSLYLWLHTVAVALLSHLRERVAIVLSSGPHSFDDSVEHEQHKQLHNAL